MNREEDHSVPDTQADQIQKPPSVRGSVRKSVQGSQKGSPRPSQDGNKELKLDSDLDNLSEKEKLIIKQDEENKENQEIQNQVIDKIDQVQGEVEDEIRNTAKNLLKFQGSQLQIAQQNSLLILACQLIICTFLSLLIAQIDPITFLWNLIPILDAISIIMFLLSLIAVQFFISLIQKKPYNFCLFIIHSIFKVFLLIYITIWIDDLRIEVLQLNYICLVAYMLFNIYIPSQSYFFQCGILLGEERSDLTIRGNWFRLTIYSVLISLFLVLFTRSEWFVWIFITLTGLIYAFFLLLCLQRFEEHQYLQKDMNDFYLGAAQLDADLIFPCWLISYHLKKKKEPEQETI